MVLLPKKKLLIVDDSAFMRKLIGDFFKDSNVIEVVGIARNGKDAIQKIKALKPDVVTLDVEMPEMNGLDALKRIMAETPVAVIMLSSTTQRGTEITLQAMAYGAVDFVAKPSGTISLDLHKIKDELVAKVENAAHVTISKLNKETTKLPRTTPKLLDRKSVASNLVSTKRVSNWSKTTKKMVLIGTSTGGPRALQEVITKLPKNMQAPVLIVQHMPAGFTKSLAERLNQLAEIEVKEAENGDIIRNGQAYIAPGGYHMKIQKVGSTYCIVLDNEEAPRAGHRPSVDVLFEDNSHYNDFDKIAVIMTGMGSDGSKGLVELKKNGHVVAIAESADTCIVYGMPKAAVETKAVNEIVDLENIAKAIIQYLP
ncbi:protein-glutamate methylesterase/protein-glutamine glutaminase [Psychrobacillus lasiicapitis]|uniref:Protein-glutamate methylesterase/protein-glutamine glutaminase n=1 Tax=Psychrobacillus lasiicapitis TaxID=1636719 RepID=A0A544TF39_9BACI|nr:chemotaxis response regulator protein-glutamate methylesterase [Psychrobacillus lasiicapitis]TQR16060.1 chemotaxis response regulator protein-glutamate methylesterase [Psychrobacillus lasiicapitis]GGA16019.1 chemotaxis response regulator protein-glutamate methylesterase [Psychrobacillus lasiicapitis]